MLTIREINENDVVIHDESGNEYEIVDRNLQLKVDGAMWFDGWVPAVSYRKNTGSYSYGEQQFVRPTQEFMKKFSVKPKVEESKE